MELVPTLRKLKLAGMANSLEIRNREAIERKLSFNEFLSLLLQDEKENREVNGLKRRRGKSHLPSQKTLEDYDFNFQPKLNKKQIFELATCKFVEKKENIVFMGHPGTGKTHLASAIGNKALLAGYKVIFTTVSDMIDNLQKGRADGSYYSKINSYLIPDLIIIDELGFKPLTQNTIHDFFEVISKRYEQKSIIITSNKMFDEWQLVFSDKILASAIIDRLIHHCHPIVITGESYRVIEHKKKTNKEN